jgi:hypothetical protein
MSGSSHGKIDILTGLGDIELLFGTAVMDAYCALEKIQTRAWPEQALCLTEPVLSDTLPGYLSEDEKQFVEVLKSLNGILQSLLCRLHILSREGGSEEIQATASRLVQKVSTNLAAKGEAPKNINTETVDSLQVILESVCSLNQRTPYQDATRILGDAEQAIETATPRMDSEMIRLAQRLQNRLYNGLLNMESSVEDIVKFNSRGEYLNLSI